MSVHRDSSRPSKPFDVRWRHDGRQRIKRFATREEALSFDESVVPTASVNSNDSGERSSLGRRAYAEESAALLLSWRRVKNWATCAG